MRCPPEIADVLLEILRIGILRIRASAWSNDARRCVHEADHVHNLPQLLVNYAPQLLAFYWQVERPALIKQLPEGECAAFESAWSRLGPLAEHSAGPKPQMAASMAAPANVE